MAEKKWEIECAQYSCRIIGYTALKEQRLVISEFMSDRDVFAVLPTRYGKSMCFACLPKAYDKLQIKRHYWQYCGRCDASRSHCYYGEYGKAILSTSNTNSGHAY